MIKVGDRFKFIYRNGIRDFNLHTGKVYKIVAIKDGGHTVQFRQEGGAASNWPVQYVDGTEKEYWEKVGKERNLPSWF